MYFEYLFFLDLHQQDADLVTVVMTERLTKVAQILVGHMVQMTKTMILVAEDFARDSSDQMMMKTLDPEIASQCMKMMMQKHINQNASRLLIPRMLPEDHLVDA